MAGSGLRSPVRLDSITTSNSSSTWPIIPPPWRARPLPSSSPPLVPMKLLVSRAVPTPGRSWQRRRAVIISGRSSPASMASTAVPSTVWPRAAASASNSLAKPAMSTWLRSSWAQALVSGLVALSCRMRPSGRPWRCS
jgi:hypothetical protein